MTTRGMLDAGARARRNDMMRRINQGELVRPIDKFAADTGAPGAALDFGKGMAAGLLGLPGDVLQMGAYGAAAIDNGIRGLLGAPKIQPADVPLTSDKIAGLLGADTSRPVTQMGLIGAPDPRDIGRAMALVGFRKGIYTQGGDILVRSLDDASPGEAYLIRADGDFDLARKSIESADIAPWVKEDALADIKKFESHKVRVGDVEENSYRGQHRAPGKDDIPAYDVTRGGIAPDDMMGPMGLRYYGDTRPSTVESFRALQAIQGNPNKTVTIYRAMPDGGAGSDINAGDWVTLSKKYAQDHAEGREGFKVVSKRVKAKTLNWDANDFNELGYNP